MKLKVLTYSLLLNALLFAVVLLASKQASRSRANYNRVLEANEELSTKLSDNQVVNGRISATNQVLQLKNKELKEYTSFITHIPYCKRLYENYGLKVKYVPTFQQKQKIVNLKTLKISYLVLKQII